VIETVTTTGWYVFGVVESDAVPPRGTYLVENGPLAAVAAEVSLAEFGDDVLPERLNDRAWLEEKVREHENVLQSFVGSSAVVPLRFGAIYRDIQDVHRLLGERRDFFEHAIERLRGHVEVGVKAWHDPTRATRPAAAGGRAYLEQRRRELSASQDAAATAAGAHDKLLAIAVAGVANRPQPRELTGREERMLLNAAYLVTVGDERLRETVHELDAAHAAHGITYELTGPWPPYNFVPDDEEPQA
jgi:hypothetical protein